MIEQRRHDRRVVTMPVNYEYEDELFRVYSRDIGCSGMFVLTDDLFDVSDVVSFSFSIPGLISPLRISAKVIRKNRFSYRRNICMPSGIGVQFEDISRKYSDGIQNFVNNPNLQPRPELRVYFEPRFCFLHAIDLSIGCENGCLYCHFSEMSKEAYASKYRAYYGPVDITSLYTIKNFPSTIFLSAASDPFSPNNRDLTHEVLSYLLPKGVVFIILTKNVIPDRTLNLIRDYNDQFEGIAIGVTNLDRTRNRVLEPNCPPAEERLACLKDLLETKVKNIRLRMDPLFPLIDDNDDNLKSMVTVASEMGVSGVTATYIFSFGRYLRRLGNEPLLKESVKNIVEKCQLQGGSSFTVPLEIKERTYRKLFKLCQSSNIHFNTCGCKESRLHDMGFSQTCRNPDFYK